VLPRITAALLILSGCTQTTPIPDESHAQWDAESADDESRSTHLWIVNRAVDILARHADLPGAGPMLERMRRDDCAAGWHQGLLDADFLAAYNGGYYDIPVGANPVQIGLAGSTWASHFYDPDTGTNYRGESDKTALNAALDHAARARELQGDVRSSCYELGLSLHFFTDVTQPMHAANFTATARPRALHSNLEGYAMTIQARYPAPDWSAQPAGDLGPFIVQTARDSKASWPGFYQRVVDAYLAASAADPLRCGDPNAASWRFIEAQQLDHTVCWAGDARVDRGIGDALLRAQDRTAQYLYLLAQQLIGH
jgi:phospholipase C